MLGFEPVVRAYLAWILRDRGRLEIQALENIWPIVVGRVWAQRTRPKALVGDRLEVVVPDHVWLQEMRFQTDTILQRLNRLLPEGHRKIASMRLSVGTAAQWVSAAPIERAGRPETAPLTEEQTAATEEIEDDQLRQLVSRVIQRSRTEGEGEP